MGQAAVLYSHPSSDTFVVCAIVVCPGGCGERVGAGTRCGVEDFVCKRHVVALDKSFVRLADWRIHPKRGHNGAVVMGLVRGTRRQQTALDVVAQRPTNDDGAGNPCCERKLVYFARSRPLAYALQSVAWLFLSRMVCPFYGTKGSINPRGCNGRWGGAGRVPRSRAGAHELACDGGAYGRAAHHAR